LLGGDMAVSVLEKQPCQSKALPGGPQAHRTKPR